MNDVLNPDMIEAINEVDITDDDKKLIRDILFIERGNKDKAWDVGDASDVYNKMLIYSDNKGDVNDIVF